MNRRALFLAFAAGGVAIVSCGYHVGGKADLMPKSVQTICIPAFTTTSTRYKLVDALPQQIGREFRARTRFRIVNDPSVADAVLNGTINSAQAYPAVLDPASGKATSIVVVVVVSVTLLERTTGRVLYSRPNYSLRQSYDVAEDPHQFFDESGPGFDRLSRDLGRDIVSAVTENF